LSLRKSGLAPDFSDPIAVRHLFRSAEELTAGESPEGLRWRALLSVLEALRHRTAGAQPELEILQLEPVHFKATVAVRPTVDLGDYRAMRIAQEPGQGFIEPVREKIEVCAGGKDYFIWLAGEFCAYEAFRPYLAAIPKPRYINVCYWRR